MQVLLNVIFDLFVCVFLTNINQRCCFRVCLHVKTVRALTWLISSYQQVARLGQRDELLVSWGAHVQADGQHLLQSRHNQRSLDGVELATPFLVSPLLVLSSRLAKKIWLYLYLALSDP